MTTAVIAGPKHVTTPTNGVPLSPVPVVERGSEEQRFVIDGIPYASYVQISDALPDRGIRITYDGGRLELMTTSKEHELYDRSLARLLDLLVLELNMEIDYGGRMTFRKEEVEKGLETDNCFWIQNELNMRGKTTFDPVIDPPPDLALEIEVSRSVLSRLDILAALRVPEVWRYDGKTIIILLLNATGQYEPSARSKAFPFLPVQELVRFLNMRATMGQTQIARTFLDWVRQQVAAGWPQA
jgi:Uma2 family endonuclease